MSYIKQRPVGILRPQTRRASKNQQAPIFERTISIGHILTILSTLITLLTIYIGWTQHQQQVSKDKSDKIRTEIAQALAKIELRQHMADSFFRDIQSLFVDTSIKYGETFDTEATRDFLWKGFDVAIANYYHKLNERDIPTSYVGLYGYYPSSGELVRHTMNNLRVSELGAFYDAQERTQQAVINFVLEEPYGTEDIGNELRGAAGQSEHAYHQAVDAEYECIKDYLITLSARSDDDLLKTVPLPAPMKSCQSQ